MEERVSVFEVETVAEMAVPFPSVSAMLVKLHSVTVDTHPPSIFTSDDERLTSSACVKATPFNSNDPEVARKTGWVIFVYVSASNETENDMNLTVPEG